MKNHNSKINNGCINIFKFLNLLYQNEADYESVYNIFKSDIIQENEVYDDKKLNNLVQVVLNKYINALRIFGVKIKKENNKFKLESSLYFYDYSIDNIKAMSILTSANNNIPDKDINKNISELVNNIILRMDVQKRNILNSLLGNYDFTFYFTNIKDQIEQCRRYCKDNVLLEINYIKKKKEEKSICKPKEIRYTIKTAILSCYDIKKKEIIEIALPNIISIDELPNRTTSFESTTTVVYKLTGRLAKTYKLKENEKLDKIEEDGITIINSGEPRDKLFSRLMRYSDLCKIITPKYIRTDMINLINESLKNYNK